MQKIETSEMPSKCDTALHLFWRALFVYFCQLWRERCFYVTMLQREEESNVLDVEIANMENRDWSGLTREDRDLFQIVPPKTASTAHKNSGCTTFNVRSRRLLFPETLHKSHYLILVLPLMTQYSLIA